MLYRLMVLMPQNWISHLAGRLAVLKKPRWFVRKLIHHFARHFQINLNEAEHPIEAYTSLQAFFVRHLKEGARPIDPAEDAMVSPCDGFWGQKSTVRQGMVLQVKNKPYSLSALLADEKWAQQLEGGHAQVLYLSPKDYHRFHAPFDCEVTGAWHVPGRLWPVNTWGVQHVDGLFSVNERVVMVLRPKNMPQQEVALVAVGATMVGSVRVNFDESLTTNTGSQEGRRCVYVEAPHRFKKGQELGRFEFGSTLVLVVPKNFGSLKLQALGEPIKMGASMGYIGQRTDLHGESIST